MPFVAKIAPVELVVGQHVHIDERIMYGGNQISDGERVFIWTSEHQGGRGLVAVGRVTSLRFTGPRVLANILVEGRALRPFNLGNIAPFRDVADGSPASELARMLYRHALNKVAALDQPTTAFLEEHFV